MKELETIEGIGPKTKELLNKIKIYTVEDLLNYYPYRYDIIKRSDLSNLSDGDKIIIDGIVEGQPTTIYINKSLKKMIFRISTKTMILNITLYNRTHLYSDLKSGKEVTIIGKYNKLKNTVIVSDIRFGLLPPSAKIEPIYYTTEGLTVKQISKFESIALENDYDVIDLVPRYIEEKYNLMNKKSAIKNIHVPEDILLLKKARQRIKYEELFMYVLKINYLKNKINNDNLAIERNIDKDKLDKFIKSLPFELTLDQDKAVNDIINDLSIKKRMNRLLQGDVGSGKTVIALIAVYANYLSKYQSALMAPTEILAVQHYEEAKKIFSKYKLNIALLTSSTSNKDKKTIYEELENGKIDLIIATQALIQENVKYKKLGLVITDEQHRFGVNQRDTFKGKGISPDVLSMSATPIPRTYALTIYGDTDVSSIKSKPKGRKEIITVFKKEKDITDVLEMMKKELELNHQIYVVSPLIEENETLDFTPVTELTTQMELAFNNKVKIGLLHGKLTKEEKERVMNDFISGKTKVLVSTTVIEVGVDNPNATMMVIFNAERFGLATLHQLRGRIGRNSLESTCILIGNEKNERLSVLASSSDGFYITEKDYEMRKEGDIFGVRQSGDMSFKIADIKRDFKVLMRAKEDSLEFLEKNDKNIFKNDEKYIKIVKETESLD